MRRFAPFAFLLLSLGCGSREALHKGKPAREWAQDLRAPSPQARRDAVSALGALKAKDFLPDLTNALKDTDDGVRARATEAIWGMSSDAKDAVPALLTSLKDKSAPVRLNAA